MIGVDGYHFLAMACELPRELSLTASDVESALAAWGNRTQDDVVILNVMVPAAGAHHSPIIAHAGGRWRLPASFKRELEISAYD